MRPGIEPKSSRILVGFLNLLSHNRNSQFSLLTKTFRIESGFPSQSSFPNTCLQGHTVYHIYSHTVTHTVTLFGDNSVLVLTELGGKMVALQTSSLSSSGS